MLALTFSFLLSTSPCLSPDIDYMALAFQEFDQTMDAGWREVANRDGCAVAAADLIQRYRESKPDLSEGQLNIMRWHEGQMRAEAGQNEQAVALFKQTYTEFDTMGWNYYVNATIAFIEQDAEALQHAHDQLVALPKPSEFKPLDADGKPMQIDWPPNLKVVEQLMSCFGRSYADAYGTCQ